VTALSLFVYGTLKRGESNHARYASGFRTACAARLRGRLYLLPAGYPILAIPADSILAHGTASPEADARTQTEWSERLASEATALYPSSDEAWPEVLGELFTYDDPAARLPDMDRLEAFQPQGESLYHRVLVRAIEPAGMPVWVYVAPQGATPPATQAISAWPVGEF
jgi:gamma-glutamylcyclotransferase (GGCT)/AIG2-like uncharacterized protein YtfP